MLRLFRRLPDGSYRLIDRVPGGPPVPMGTVQKGEMIVIDGDEGQVEITIFTDDEALVKLRLDRPHAVPPLEDDDCQTPDAAT